jgi:hypothetical protein
LFYTTHGRRRGFLSFYEKVTGNVISRRLLEKYKIYVFGNSILKYTCIFATLEKAKIFYVMELLIRFQGSFSWIRDAIFILKYVEVNSVLMFFASLISVFYYSSFMRDIFGFM